jgi:hypothetical protein
MSRRLPSLLRTFCFSIALLGGVASAQSANQLSIVEEPLPVLEDGVDIKIALHARGGAPPYHWRITDAAPPNGIILTSDGILSGRPAQPGLFDFTVAVDDSAHPANSVSKRIQTRVAATLLLEWLYPPKVNGGSIDGAVKVSNGSKDDFDLTFVIVAVNENGRATALGYQHFTLKSGTMWVPINFGSSLPPGSYLVHADAVAEVPAKNSIMRRQLQTPAPLPITQGP